MADYRELSQHPILTMPQPAGEIAFFTVAAAVALLALLALIRFRRDSGTFLLTLVAGLACCGMEAFAEYIAMNYHPEIGGSIAYRAWGMPVPIHIALSYGLYFGGPGYLLLRLAERGPSIAAWWRTYAANFFFVALADLVAVNTGLWTYYGHQPFMFFGVPVVWLFCNTTTIIGFAVVVHACLAHFKGIQRLQTIVLAPIGLAMTWAGLTLPIGNMLHSEAGPGLIAIGGLLSIAICLYTAQLAFQYFQSAARTSVAPSRAAFRAARSSDAAPLPN